ncbi:MAG: GTP-binding protein [Christensenellales bacterium]
MGTGIPVVVIRGILEGGKTYFINDSIMNGDFGDIGRTLILVQEEGIEEYDEALLKKFDSVAVSVEKDEWTDSRIYELVRRYKPQFVFIEKNEMWDTAEEKTFIPDYFDVQQVIGIADGQTFSAYLNNMRQKLVDVIKECDLFIVNRCEATQETSQMKNNVKLINPSVTVIALDEDGRELRLVSDLPYDVSSPVISLKLSDFGAFYVDTFDNKDRYDGKIVETVCQAAISRGFPPNTFVAGRQAMTCCAADIQFIGHLCAYDNRFKVKNKSWIYLTARIHYIEVPGIPEEQIVLEAMDIQPVAPPPEEEQVISLV